MIQQSGSQSLFDSQNSHLAGQVLLIPNFSARWRMHLQEITPVPALATHGLC